MRTLILLLVLGLAAAADPAGSESESIGSPSPVVATDDAATDPENAEAGPAGRLHRWALMQKNQDAKPSDPNAPDTEMQSITGGATGGALEEVDLDSATGATGAAEGSGAAAGSAAGSGTGGTGGTGGAGGDISPKLRSKLRSFGERLVDLFVTGTDPSPEHRDKFRGSAERMMRNMTAEELVTGMALNDAEAKELTTLSMDSMVPIAVPSLSAAGPTAGGDADGKNDPVAEKAAEAEADVMTAEKEIADVKYTKAYSAEMRLAGYDGETFKKAQRDMFLGYVAKLTGAARADVTIDGFGVVTGRRLLKAGAAGSKVKVSFTVQAKGADGAAKGAAAINGLDAAAAVAALKAAGLTAVTGVEVSKKATVEDTSAKLAADFKVEKAKQTASQAQDDAKEEAGAKAAASGDAVGVVKAKSKKKGALKLRSGAGHWVWTLNRSKQWALSGMAKSFWARQQAKIAAKAAAKAEKAVDGATGGATGATGPAPVAANPL